MRVTGRLLLLLCAFANWLPAALASEILYHSTKKFSYSLNLSLLLLDELRPPTVKPAAIKMAPTGDEADQKRSRGFGLEFAKFQGRWSLNETASLELGIRPDALTRRSELDSPPSTREFDTRAGNNLPQKPRISLLDTYELNLRRGESFGLAAGVFTGLAKRRISYPEVLEFGLVVPFPSKISALQATLNHPMASLARTGPSKRVVTEAYIYQGDEDRAEIIDPGNGRPYDHGTILSDPYQGGSVYFGLLVDRRFDFGVLMGGGDSAIQDGRRNDFLLQVSGSWGEESVALPFRIHLDGRVKREKWNVPSAPRVPLEHRSMSLTGAVLLARQTSWLLGVQNGSSQRHSSSDSSLTNGTNGYQMESGVLYDFGDGLLLTGMMAQERRALADDDGSNIGAFGSRSDSTLVIRRFAMELNYFFSDGGLAR